jgi:hypothetical protein
LLYLIAGLFAVLYILDNWIDLFEISLIFVAVALILTLIASVVLIVGSQIPSQNDMERIKRYYGGQRTKRRRTRNDQTGEADNASAS